MDFELRFGFEKNHVFGSVLCSLSINLCKYYYYYLL